MIEALLLFFLAVIGLGIIHTLHHRTIIVINRKDPAMATIKERLAALEAASASQGAAAAVETVTALTDRVTAIEAEIGTEPVAEPVAFDATPIPATEG